MTATRKTPPRRNLIAAELREFANRLEACVPGWTALHDELADSGWPARSPDDDRADRRARGTAEPDEEGAGRPDYADPTGDAALRIGRLHDDRYDVQDHCHALLDVCGQSVTAIERITSKYRLIGATIPACSEQGCAEPVESRRLAGGGVTFRGMEQVDGVWLAKPGIEPKCTKHRKQRERAA